MKILFVLEYYYPHIGGVERLFKSLTEYLVTRGNEVTVLTNKFRKDLLSNETINGVMVRRLGFRNRYLFTFLSLPWVISYGKNHDLIHTTSFNAAFPAYFASLALRKTAIITFHEAWGKLWFKLPFINPVSKILYYLYEQLIIRFCFSKFVAVSDYTRQCLVRQGVKPQRIELVYNGLVYETRQFVKNTDEKKFVFTFFGRLGPSKGIDILMKASAIFLKNHPNAGLRLIISKEPGLIYNYVKMMVGKNNLENQVEIHHHLSEPDLRQKLLTSQCVVIPSISEGFCFAAAETVALGIPLVSSDMGALKEVVSGTWVKMGFYTVDELVKALEKAYSGDWSKTPVKKFELTKSLNHYLKIYSVMLRNQ